MIYGRLGSLAAGMLVAACQSMAPGATGPVPSSDPGPRSPTAVDATATASPIATECSLGTAVAEHHYAGLRELARFSHGVAVAEVVAVGDVQYSTESGERPTCEYLAAARSVFGVGRIVDLRIETPLGGTARRGATARYMFPGGRIGNDRSAGHHFGVALPDVGDRVLVLLAERPIDVDGGPGELGVDVIELFALTADGRVETPDPRERPTVDRVRELVRGVLASPAATD